MYKKFRLFLSAYLVFIASTANAQSWYISPGIGYAFPLAGQTLDGTGTPLSGSVNKYAGSTDTLVSYSLKRASFTSGTHLSLAGGYMFNDNIGIELGLNIGMGMKQLDFYDNNTVVSGIAANVQVQQQAKSPVLLTPSLVLQTGVGKLNVYTKMGMVIPLSTNIREDQIFSTLPGFGAIHTEDDQYQIKNFFSFGFSASAGCMYKVSDKTSIFGEVNMLSMSIFIKEADLTNVTVDGQNSFVNGAGQTVTYLSTVPQKQQKIYFSNNYTTTAADQYHQPSYAQPFSNCSISFGLKYSFGKNQPVNKKGNGQVHKKYDEEDHINNVKGF